MVSASITFSDFNHWRHRLYASLTLLIQCNSASHDSLLLKNSCTKAKNRLTPNVHTGQCLALPPGLSLQPDIRQNWRIQSLAGGTGRARENPLFSAELVFTASKFEQKSEKWPMFGLPFRPKNNRKWPWFLVHCRQNDPRITAVLLLWQNTDHMDMKSSIKVCHFLWGESVALFPLMYSWLHTYILAYYWYYAPFSFYSVIASVSTRMYMVGRNSRTGNFIAIWKYISHAIQNLKPADIQTLETCLQFSQIQHYITSIRKPA